MSPYTIEGAHGDDATVFFRHVETPGYARSGDRSLWPANVPAVVYLPSRTRDLDAGWRVAIPARLWAVTLALEPVVRGDASLYLSLVAVYLLSAVLRRGFTVEDLLTVSQVEDRRRYYRWPGALAPFIPLDLWLLAEAAIAPQSQRRRKKNRESLGVIVCVGVDP